MMDRRRLGLLIGAAAAAYLLFLVAPLILLCLLYTSDAADE